MGGAVRVGRLAVAIFDLNPESMERASIEVERRTRALVALGRAPDSIVEQGLRELQRATFFRSDPGCRLGNRAIRRMSAPSRSCSCDRGRRQP